MTLANKEDSQTCDFNVMRADERKWIRNVHVDKCLGSLFFTLVLYFKSKSAWLVQDANLDACDVGREFIVGGLGMKVESTMSCRESLR